MMELFDMGKYDFFVWTSIAVFIVALLLDALNIKAQRTQLHRAIRSAALKKRARQAQADNPPTQRSDDS
ncbi:heme exporter protein CcmD [Marinicella meishanensis]|uniref:heme exporter protein CcmD n=1 Tax=Marinicella meishanensis TaxID=2873263 RepID=UPI001CBACE13|nr:heme exporter protein CcmD [Marinicella sp. NBU2979]